MENYSSTAGSGASRTAEDARRLGSELKSEAQGIAGRAAEAAKELGEHASWALNDLKSAGRGVVDEYSEKLGSRKRQIQDAARRVEEYSDKNTALVAGGTLLIGVLLGHILTRRSDS